MNAPIGIGLGAWAGLLARAKLLGGLVDVGTTAEGNVLLEKAAQVLASRPPLHRLSSRKAFLLLSGDTESLSVNGAHGNVPSVSVQNRNPALRPLLICKITTLVVVMVLAFSIVLCARAWAKVWGRSKVTG